MAIQKQNTEILKELKEALSMITHSSVCDLYQKITTMKLVCYDIEASRMYYYNKDTQLYTQIGLKELAMKVSQTLRDYLSNEIGQADLSNMKSFGTLLKSIGNMTFLQNVAALLCGTCYDKDFISKIDYDKTTINFKNGLVCLKTGEFRKRTRKDYVSKCLNYDYKEETSKKMKTTILSLMSKICNDDNTVLEDNLKWFGYCLTGETKQQKFLCTIGHSAQNGKSTLAKMFDCAFDIYSIKLDKQSFTKDYSKRHKQFALIKQPIRYAYIEEIDRSKLDGDVLKDFVDGYEINNEIMFGTSETIELQCKLNLLSNNNLNFDTDEGLKRRGFRQEFTNKFLEETHKDYTKGAKGIYLKDENILDMIKTTEFKLALCQIVIPYAIKYYADGLTVSQGLTQSFNELCEENDKMKEFMTKNYVITNEAQDRVHKDTFLAHYRMDTGLKMISWQNLLNDVKRIGLNYKKNLTCGGRQGCILGIKRRDDEGEDLFANDLDTVDDAPQALKFSKRIQSGSRSGKNTDNEKRVMKKISLWLSEHSSKQVKDLAEIADDVLGMFN